MHRANDKPQWFWLVLGGFLFGLGMGHLLLPFAPNADILAVVFITMGVLWIAWPPRPRSRPLWKR